MLEVPLPPPVPATLPPRPRGRDFGWVLRAALPISLLAASALVSLVQVSLHATARLVFFGFAAATVLWCTTKLNSSFVALAAVLFLVVVGAADERVLLTSLSSDVVWLMIGAFIVAAALRETGLAERLTRSLLSRARTTAGAFWWLTLALLPLAAFFPSTTGRAAVALPIYLEVADALRDRKASRALSLLVPAVTLTATSATLVAASSHLITNELLSKAGHPPLSYARWALYGAPFALLSSLATCGLILRLLLDEKRRRQPFRLPAGARDAGAKGASPRVESPRVESPGTASPRTAGQRLAIVVSSAMVLLWLTQGLHPLGVTTITLAGAIVLCTPKLGCISWNRGLGAVQWNLVLFVGAAIALGNLLLDSGVIAWLLSGLFRVARHGASSELVLLVGVATLSITLHLYVHSHTTRVVLLIPPLLVLAEQRQLNAPALVFFATLGTNYCLTLPVHSKCFLLFQEANADGFETTDLLRLSAALLPVYFALLLASYYLFWRPAGLGL